MGLEALLATVRACRICAEAARPLPHEPRPVLQPGPKARILIAGQAPGVRVHASGKPFTLTWPLAGAASAMDSAALGCAELR